MIITKKKHKSIVSMKDCDIKILENRVEGLKDLIKKRDLEIYELNQEANNLSDELDKTKEHLKDTDIALDLMIDKVDELEHENEELGDKILNMQEDNVDLQKENKEYKNQLDIVKEMLRQYKWYIDKSMEAGFANNCTITYKDMQKFHSKEGIDGIMKLYQLASMMQ